MDKSRRDFIKKVTLSYALLTGIPILKIDDMFQENSDNADLSVVVGKDPLLSTRKSIEIIGGIKKFISKGDKVVIKPNIGWARTPEQAACTNPFVVKAIIELCMEAGAASVTVTDRSCQAAAICFSKSGIEDIAKKAGANVIIPSASHFVNVNLKGTNIKDASVLKILIEADKLINVPIAKHHSLTKLTLGMKNWFGGMGGKRGSFHKNIHACIADMAAFFRPHLTVIDGYRILLRNGPIGGNLDDVELKSTIIAGTDPIAADTLASQLFGISEKSIQHIMIGEKKGLGTTNINSLKIVKIALT